MKNQKLFGNSILLLTALIWGCAFVAQSIGMDYIQPFTFTAARSFIGGIALIPVVLCFARPRRGSAAPTTSTPQNKKDLLIASLLCGTFLCLGTNLQQVGLVYTTAGKAGFITALYIVLVPIMSIFLKKHVPFTVWISVLISTCGLYLLCMKENLTVSVGDFYVFLCAFAFTLQIITIDHYNGRVNGILLACNQLWVSAILSAVCMFLFETPSLSAILTAWAPILYAGVLSSGVGYTLQIIGQKYTAPTVASLLMSLESVFAALAGFLILHETLTSREFLGCLLMFSAIILAQIPLPRRK